MVGRFNIECYLKNNSNNVQSKISNVALDINKEKPLSYIII